MEPSSDLFNLGSPNATAPNRPVKPRYRVSKVKSCAECRRLKLKCDRQVPCENCVRREASWLCPDGIMEDKERERVGAVMETSRQLGTTEQLQRRIIQLENTLNNLISSSGSPQSLIHRSEPAISPSTRRDDLAAVSSGSSRGSEIQYGHFLFDRGDMRSSRFYGDASSLFLADQSSDDASQGTTSSFRTGWVEAFLFERDSALQLNRSLGQLINQLPKHEEAQRLMGLYFENVAWGTNILVAEIFKVDVLERFYGDGGPPDVQRLAVLFLALALGSLFDPGAIAGASNNPYSRDLFALGRACLSLDATPSVIFLQACHLMCTWLINGRGAVNANQASWTILGVAMRGAQTLGLHRDGEVFEFPPDEIKERRRVFWEIYAYDVSQAVATGRPRCMTGSSFDVKIPAASEAEDKYHEARYTLSSCLARINDEQIALTPSSYEVIVQLDRDIRQYQQNLPAQLTTEQSPASSRSASQRTHDVQKHTIGFQATLALLTLHRSWFARALLDVPEEPLRSKYSPSYVGCLEACKLLLESIRRLSLAAPSVYSRRWFFLFHAFTACACLAASVIRAPRSMLAQSSLLALEDGMTLFKQANKQDELTMLLRLSDTAKKCFGQAGRSHPADEEDLAMLGKGRQSKVSTRQLPRSTDIAAGPDSFRAMTFIPQAPVQAVLPTAVENPASEAIQRVPEIPPVEQFTQDSSSEFDFDAFLANFGLASDVTDLFGDLNGDWTYNNA